VLVIPAGAAQPPRPGLPTALEAARTPVLDELATEGAVARVATTPTGLPPGAETGIASLLGSVPRATVGGGWVDAAAYGVPVPEGLVPWRADVLYRSGRRASIRQARDVCAHLGRCARVTAGNRLLLLSGERPPDRRLLGLDVRVWPRGEPPRGPLPVETVVICAQGVAAGTAKLIGARVICPPGATGDLDTDLCAKARAALAAIRANAPRVVVHLGATDEAAHRRQPAAVVEALERMDCELLGPIRDAVASRGGRLAVCPDHGTDPLTGRHDPAPVPALVWGRGVAQAGPAAITERASWEAPLIGPLELLADWHAVAR